MKTGRISILIPAIAIIALLSSGCTKSPEEVLRDKVNKAPKQVEAHNNLAYYLSTVGKYEEALEEYNKSLALRPGDFLATNNKGQLLYQMGRYQDALKIFLEIAKTPGGGKRSDTYSNIAMCYHNTKHYPEAYYNYKKALSLSNQNKPAQDGFTLLLSDLKKEKLTEKDMIKALEAAQAAQAAQKAGTQAPAPVEEAPKGK